MINLSEKEIKVRLLIAEALRWVGTKEEQNNSGALVNLFQNWDGHPDQVPWCAAFVQYCLKMSCYTYDSIVQRCSKWHNITQTEHCQTMFYKTDTKVDLPQLGDIVVWAHYKDGKNTGSGHCGIVAEIIDGHTFTSIEGNTSDGSGINREGEGVYMKQRTIKDSDTFKILGFLRPWS